MEYEPISYSITFDGNGADDGEMDAITATYDEEYTLTANTFTRNGYTFTGWNTEADGSGTSYEDGATVSNLTTEDGATVTLYAQWEENTSDYTITVTEYTGGDLEAEYDYEEGALILYFIDGFDTAEYAQLGSYAITDLSEPIYPSDYTEKYENIHKGYTMNSKNKIFLNFGLRVLLY